MEKERKRQKRQIGSSPVENRQEAETQKEGALGYVFFHRPPSHVVMLPRLLSAPGYFQNGNFHPPSV